MSNRRPNGRVQSVERAVELLRADRGRARAGAGGGARRSLRAQPQHRVAHAGHARAPRARRARPCDAHYSTPTASLRLAAAAGSRAARAARARPLLRRLGGGDRRDRRTSPSPNGLELVYVDQVQASHVMAAELARAHAVPLHATSTGKALLAALAPGRARARCCARPLERYTETTIIDPAALRAELGDGAPSADTRHRAASSSRRCGASRLRCTTAVARGRGRQRMGHRVARARATRWSRRACGGGRGGARRAARGLNAQPRRVRADYRCMARRQLLLLLLALPMIAVYPLLPDGSLWSPAGSP